MEIEIKTKILYYERECIITMVANVMTMLLSGEIYVELSFKNRIGNSNS